MKVFITGGTGFLGTALTEKLLAEGNKVSILTRGTPERPGRAGLVYVKGNPVEKGRWQDEVGNHDVVINLAGASIFRSWNAKNKEAIYNSRIFTTRNIVDAVASHSVKNITLLNGSAVGFYGFSNDAELDEQSPAGDDFLATLAKDWEAEALRAEKFGVRVVLCRIGVILGRDGGALSKMLSVFKWGLGSPLGSGRQWFSWVTLPDLVNIFIFLMANREITGPVNCTSPYPVTNKEMTDALGRALHRPVFLPHVPSFLIRGILGEFSNVFLKGQRVIPAKLLQKGFIFEFPGINDAFAEFVK